jgi:O6-methylguanine-DNA--protein-cysteine methyltransferase
MNIYEHPTWKRRKAYPQQELPRWERIAIGALLGLSMAMAAIGLIALGFFLPGCAKGPAARFSSATTQAIARNGEIKAAVHAAAELGQQAKAEAPAAGKTLDLQADYLFVAEKKAGEQQDDLEQVGKAFAAFEQASEQRYLAMVKDRDQQKAGKEAETLAKQAAQAKYHDAYLGGATWRLIGWITGGGIFLTLLGLFLNAKTDWFVAVWDILVNIVLGAVKMVVAIIKRIGASFKPAEGPRP